MRRIIFASDHVGYPLKHFLFQYLSEKGLEVVDAGPDSPDQVVDYPDYAQKAARAVALGQYDGGIVICGTGLGVSIAANKVQGARAALCTDTYTAHQARAHNDANILAMGAWVTTPQRAVGIVDEWLATPFEGGRHVPRVKKLNASPNLAGVAAATEPDPVQRGDFCYGVSISARETLFGPVLFAGQLWQGIRAVGEAGLDHVEISMRNAEDIDVVELRRALSQAGLGLAAVATGQGCIHDGLCLAAVDAETRQAAVRRMEKLVDFAGRLDAGIIIGGVRGTLGAPEGQRAAQRAQAMEAVIASARYAARCSVPVYIEPINRYETNFVNTVAEGLAVLEAINEPQSKLLLDTFHMNIEEVDLPNALRAAGDRLGYVHFADSNRQAPGRGHIDFLALLRTLRGMGYQGRITAEILPLPDDEAALQGVTQFLNALPSGPASR